MANIRDTVKNEITILINPDHRDSRTDKSVVLHSFTA